MNIHLDPKYERQLDDLASTTGKSIDEILQEFVRKGLAEAHSKSTRTTVAPGQRSLLELEGLGKEIWEGVDPVEYINELRADWD